MQDTPQQMQAMAVNEFGGPDKLTLHTLPVPTVDAGEVLIRIEIAGVGIWDEMEREGELVYNEVHFPRVLGGECAGTIVAIGDGVDRFAVGDRQEDASAADAAGVHFFWAETWLTRWNSLQYQLKP